MVKHLPDLPRPARSASKAAWVEYVTATYGDVDFVTADDCTRAELIDACDQAEAQAAAARDARRAAEEQQLADAAAARGAVEVAVRAELHKDHLSDTALAASAIAMARHVDDAETAGAAASAARELRMTLSLARSALLSRRPAEPVEDDEDGVVVGPNRLLQLREKVGGASSR